MSQEQNEAPFVPPPPPQPSIGSSLYPPHVLEQKAKEVSDNIRTGFILGGIGVLCFGFILGYLAYRRGNDAMQTIDIYEVAKDKRNLALAVKIIGIVDIVGWAIGLLIRFAAPEVFM